MANYKKTETPSHADYCKNHKLGMLDVLRKIGSIIVALVVLLCLKVAPIFRVKRKRKTKHGRPI